MARLLTTGAESGSATTEGITLASPAAFSTSGARSGTRCFDFSAGTVGNISYSFTGALATHYYARSYFYMSARPSATFVLLIMSSPRVKMTTSGALELFNFNTQIGSDSAAVPLNTWFCLELHSFPNSGTNTATMEARIDGVTFASSTTETDTVAPGSIQLGDNTGISAMTTFKADDVALNDSTGSAQTSWPGAGNIVLLLPTSDNSAGSWKAGSAASAVSNGALFNAVDNTPPVGTASPDAATAAISNAVSGATTPNYDANMTTYTAAGIAAADTVNLVQQIIAHGEDIATGTKTGTFAMVSNPAVAASASFNFGADAGAAGTYPTTWTVARGAVSYAPSVTLGTAPVARITKTDTGTRAADCCFMGLYVDYTPAVETRRPPLRASLQAVNRSAVI